MSKSNKNYISVKKLPLRFIPIMTLTIFSINILGLVLPLTMKKIYGSIIVSKSADMLRYILLLAVLAMALEAIMRKVKESSSKWIAAKFEFQLSTLMITKVLSTSGRTGQNYISNMEKFKSVSKVAAFYSTAYYQLFIDVPFMFLFLYLIYIYGKALVLIPIGLAVLYIIIIYFVTNMYFRSQKAYVITNDKLMTQLIETLEKIHLIKSSGIEESQINKYKKLQDEVSKTEFKSNQLKTIPKILSGNLSQMTLFSILITGGYLVSLDMATFAQITACAILGGRAISPVVSLMRYYQQTREISILKERIEDIALSEDLYSTDIPNFPEEIMGTIELLDLEYENLQSRNHKTISINIGAGDFVIIDPIEFPSYRRVLKKMIGNDVIHSGKILIDNLDIEQWNMHSLKGKIEYLSEKVSIYKGSVMENITFFNTGQIQNAFEAASITRLDEMVRKMPEGFETQLDSHMINYLSAGFIQRLNLSRALLERPRILIFDRIDENMDQETLEQFLWLLGKLKGSTTIIITSKNESVLALGDYNLVEGNTVLREDSYVR
jgi:ATP-binding cassette subfamily C protein LapB